MNKPATPEHNDADYGFIGKDAYYLSKQIDGLQRAAEARDARIDSNYKDTNARIDEMNKGIIARLDSDKGRWITTLVAIAVAALTIILTR